jgi:ribosome-associated protein
MERLTKAELIAEAVSERKGEDLVVLDIREVASFADTFILVTGTSDRQVRSITDSIEETLARHGERAMGIEGYDEGRWVLIDLGDAIVHIFQPDVREYYDLERLWSEAPTVELRGAAAQEVSR